METKGFSCFIYQKFFLVETKGLVSQMEIRGLVSQMETKGLSCFKRQHSPIYLSLYTD
jgi:hypothetical protein